MKHIWQIREKSKGMSLTEVLIAVGILAIVASAISFFVVGAKKQLKVVAGSAECTNAAQSVIESFTNLGTRDTILPPFIPDSNSSARKPTGSPKPAWVSQWVTQDVINTTSPAIIYNSQMIVGAAGLAQALMNSDVAYCNSSILTGGNIYEDEEVRGKEVPLSNFGIGTGLTGARLFLNIIPLSADQGKYLDCRANPGDPPILGRPYGSTPPAGYTMGGDPNVSFQVIATIEHTDAGQKKLCQAENKYGFQLDQANVSERPVVSTVNKPTTGGGTPLIEYGGGAFLSCDKFSSYKDIRLYIDFPKIEDGSVFLCKGTTRTSGGVTTTGDWYACDSILFPGQTTASTVSSWNSAAKQLTLEIRNLPEEMKYTLEFMTVDTAGNPSPIGSTTFLLDAQRPGVGSISEDDSSYFPKIGKRIKAPGSGGPNGHAPLPPHMGVVNWSIVDSYNANVLQCNTESVTLRAPISGSWPETYSSCTCQNLACGGSTFCRGATTNPITHGQYDVTMTAHDMCDAGGSESYSWKIALPQPGAGIAPAHQSFERDTTKTTDIYTYIVPTPNIPPPRHFVVECDCSGNTTAAPPIPFIENSVNCPAKIDLAGDGCTIPTVVGGKNFRYNLWDICGRQIGGLWETTYDVKGDENDQCHTQSCGVSGNGIGQDGLICCLDNVNSNEEDCTRGRCTKGVAAPACTDPNWFGRPPQQNRGQCPDPGLYQCDYLGICLGSELGTSRRVVECDFAYTGVGPTDYSTPGADCQFQHQGGCAPSLDGTCEAAGCPVGDTTCRGPRVYGDDCNDPGDTGRLCYFLKDSTCSPLTSGSCTPLPWAPVTAPNPNKNPVCPDRGVGCYSMPPPPPDLCDANAGKYNTQQECSAYETAQCLCAPEDAPSTCFELNCCGGTGVVNPSYCSALITTDPAKVDTWVCRLAPGSVTPKLPAGCTVPTDCGQTNTRQNWNTQNMCVNNPTDPCAASCNTVDANVPACYSCSNACRLTANPKEFATQAECEATFEAPLRNYCESVMVNGPSGSSTCWVKRTCPVDPGPPYSYYGMANCVATIGQPYTNYCSALANPVDAGNNPMCFEKKTCAAGTYTTNAACQASTTCKTCDCQSTPEGCFTCVPSNCGNCRQMVYEAAAYNNCPAEFNRLCEGTYETGMTCNKTSDCDFCTTTECEASIPTDGTSYCFEKCVSCYEEAECAAGYYTSKAKCDAATGKSCVQPSGAEAGVDPCLWKAPSTCTPPGVQSSTCNGNCPGAECTEVTDEAGCYTCPTCESKGLFSESTCGGVTAPSTCTPDAVYKLCYKKTVVSCAPPGSSEGGCTPNPCTGANACAEPMAGCHYCCEQTQGKFKGSTCAGTCNAVTQTCEPDGLCFSCVNKCSESTQWAANNCNGQCAGPGSVCAAVGAPSPCYQCVQACNESNEWAANNCNGQCTAPGASCVAVGAPSPCYKCQASSCNESTEWASSNCNGTCSGNNKLCRQKANSCYECLDCGSNYPNNQCKIGNTVQCQSYEDCVGANPNGCYRCADQCTDSNEYRTNACDPAKAATGGCTLPATCQSKDTFCYECRGTCNAGEQVYQDCIDTKKSYETCNEVVARPGCYTKSGTCPSGWTDPGPSSCASGQYVETNSTYAECKKCSDVCNTDETWCANCGNCNNTCNTQYQTCTDRWSQGSKCFKCENTCLANQYLAADCNGECTGFDPETGISNICVSVVGSPSCHHCRPSGQSVCTWEEHFEGNQGSCSYTGDSPAGCSNWSAPNPLTCTPGEDPIQGCRVCGNGIESWSEYRCVCP